MNKKLIVLAVAAGLAAPIAAHAGPTVYGNLQGELANIKNDGYGTAGTGSQADSGAASTSYVGVATNQSALKVEDNKRGRLGIKGDEDLGGGLKAVYGFEWQVETTTGDVNDGQRETFVGLKGGFGEVQVGRLKTPYKYFGGVKYDPFVTTTLEARRNGGMTGGTFGQNAFSSNSLAYKNKFGAVELWVVAGMDEGTGASPSTGNDGDLFYGVKYNANNFEVFLAGASDDSKNYDATKLGGQFKAGGHTISAQYETIDNYTATNNNADVYFLGYEFKMNKTSFVAQLGSTDVDGGSANDADYLAAGVVHKFSKKTRVFAGYRKTDGNGAADLTSTSVGLRVDF